MKEIKRQKKMGCLESHPKVRMVWTTMKKLSYLVINGVLPLADVTSDYLTYLNLLENNHELFALGNLLIMFLPFFFKLGLFLADFVCGKRPDIEHFAGLMMHLPFISPVVHILLGIRLLFFDHTDAAQTASIEQFQKVTIEKTEQG